ncbi:glycosyltransferase [Brackiella oedipodis]|uniref:glycosyltransferase n=1 Tax=Brackiella oedipodis TaxID=124225 RepID=UPI001B802B76
MCTYNGAEFIQAQLDSFAAQNNNHWSLWVSDDGSSDQTVEQVQDFMRRHQVVGEVVQGPKQGFAKNFQSLTSLPQIEADYYAFADQDDIFCSDKLTRAVAWLEQQDRTKPALYCSRTQLINEHNVVTGYSPNNTKAPGFGNALIQNIASGNTMVFNKAARHLFVQACHVPMVFHDWSLYQIVTACEGAVYFDSHPTVLYRQHSQNVVGNGMALQRRIKNFLAVHQGRSREWNSINIHVLEQVREHMSPRAAEQLQCFKAMRSANLWQRLQLMRQAGLYHQHCLGGLTTLSYVLRNRL